MTRNTKLHKAKNVKLKNGGNTDVLFRTLTVIELSFLNNIKKETDRTEYAARISITNINPSEIEWPTRMSIGKSAIDKSTKVIRDNELFEITVKEFRNSVDNDPVMGAISRIKEVFPGSSIIDLLNLTHEDLIELVCLCEQITGKPIYKISGGLKNKSMSLVNTNDIPEEARDKIQKQINSLNRKMGIPR